MPDVTQSNDVAAHYDRYREEDRLRDGVGQIELLRTQQVLRRHLPPSPAEIVDVGGATGVHAEWLLDDGYQVHLVDLTPRHVEQALIRLGERGLSASVGDARQLTRPDASADVVLVFGPLYHLHERADRVRVLREAYRVVRRGGLIAVAAISRFASLFDGLARGFLFEPEFRAIVDTDLLDGRHRNPTDRHEWFTTAYFHLPDELADEVGDAGLTMVELVGLEGLAGWLPQLDDRMRDADDRNVIIDAARRTESEPTLLGLSPHLLAVARRPT